MPFPRDPTVHEVRDAGVGEESESPGMRVVENEIADDGGGDEARQGEEVRDSVDILMWRELC